MYTMIPYYLADLILASYRWLGGNFKSSNQKPKPGLGRGRWTSDNHPILCKSGKGVTGESA